MSNTEKAMQPFKNFIEDITTSKAKDLTEFIPELFDGVNIIDELIDNKVLTGSIHLTDERIWNAPGYNSTDGLPTLIGGDVTIELYDLDWIDADGESYDFDIDEEYLLQIWKDANNG